MKFVNGVSYKLFRQDMEEAAISPITCTGIDSKRGLVRFNVGNQVAIESIKDGHDGNQYAYLSLNSFKLYSGICSKDIADKTK